MSTSRRSWTYSETQLLIENFDSPIQDLIVLFPRHSQSSIDRKLTRLRQEGKIGKKSQETIREAYQKRHA